MLRHRDGHRLVLGAGEAADDAFIAAASAWPDALVFVDTRGLAHRLHRTDVVRVAPGRSDSAQLNPLLAIRRGPHAFRDASLLAAGLIGATATGETIAGFAALMLDHLHAAPPEARTLAGLRRRLLDRDATLRALAGAAQTQAPDGAMQPPPEIARLARHWRADPEAAHRVFAEAERALAPFQDGRLAEATVRLDLHLCDAASEGPRTILLEAPPGEGARYGPVLAALVGQLVAQLTDALETDTFGRRKARRVLVALDNPAAIGFVPLLAARVAVAPRCGLELLVRARTASQGAALVDADASLDAYDAVAVCGPLDDASADVVSACSGPRAVLRLRSGTGGSWRYLLPVIEIGASPRLEALQLERASEEDAVVVMRTLGPVKMHALAQPPPGLRLSTGPLAPPPHDWSGAAVVQAPASMDRALTAPAPLPLFERDDPRDGDDAPSQATDHSVVGRLRAGLTRGARRRS
jgi:type IV secretory pathway TraG/TraD family ATPase VirD4